MNEELENKLFEKYPQLFPNARKNPLTESLMCFGMECDDGWYNLIDETLNNIVTYCDKKNIFYPIIIQIKEKFAELRIYCSNVQDPEIWSIISEAENKSGKICEQCGEPAKVRDYGWLKTLCKTCWDNKQKEFLKNYKKRKIKNAGKSDGQKVRTGKKTQA